MKTLKLTGTLFLAIVLFACTSKSGEEGDFSGVKSDLDSKFGEKAYYTEISITYNQSIGNITNVIVTKAPETLKMEQWTNSMNNWTQTSDITIEIPNGTKATDFMFQLGRTVSLEKLSELVANSKEKLTSEKQIDSPKLHMAFIKYPDNGQVNEAEYIVMLQPKNGGTTFTFSYKLDGTLLKMDE